MGLEFERQVCIRDKSLGVISRWRVFKTITLAQERGGEKTKQNKV